MNKRQFQVLGEIVSQYVATGIPIGSKQLLEGSQLAVSAPTIRNDMAYLESENLISKRHISSGRLPTDAGYRFFLDAILSDERYQIQGSADNKSPQIDENEDLVYQAVAHLAEASGLLAFGILPSGRAYYLGISSLMAEPEFTDEPIKIQQLVATIERSREFSGLLLQLDIKDRIKVYIGEENVLPTMKGVSMLITRYHLDQRDGVIGLIGPTRIDYLKQIALLKLIIEGMGLQPYVVVLPEKMLLLTEGE